MIVHNCLCYLTTVQRKDSAAVITDLGRWVRGDAVPGFDGVGSVPLESAALMDWLTGFPVPSRA
jgi:hypothetical protein